jgi:hypothetical protein
MVKVGRPRLQSIGADSESFARDDMGGDPAHAAGARQDNVDEDLGRPGDVPSDTDQNRMPPRRLGADPSSETG